MINELNKHSIMLLPKLLIVLNWHRYRYIVQKSKTDSIKLIFVIVHPSSLLEFAYLETFPKLKKKLF